MPLKHRTICHYGTQAHTHGRRIRRHQNSFYQSWLKGMKNVCNLFAFIISLGNSSDFAAFIILKQGGKEWASSAIMPEGGSSLLIICTILIYENPSCEDTRWAAGFEWIFSSQFNGYLPSALHSETRHELVWLLRRFNAAHRIKTLELFFLNFSETCLIWSDAYSVCR